MPENNLKSALERMSQDLKRIQLKNIGSNSFNDCLLYTSDAADE